MKDKVAKVKGVYNEKMIQIRKEVVDFVVLKNYSILNYTKKLGLNMFLVITFVSILIPPVFVWFMSLIFLN